MKAMVYAGTPAAFEPCTTLVRPGGRVANIGVPGKPATLHLDDRWIRNITITPGLVDTYTTPKLLRMLATTRGTQGSGLPSLRRDNRGAYRDGR